MLKQPRRLEETGRISSVVMSQLPQPTRLNVDVTSPNRESMPAGYVHTVRNTQDAPRKAETSHLRQLNLFSDVDWASRTAHSTPPPPVRGSWGGTWCFWEISDERGPDRLDQRSSDPSAGGEQPHSSCDLRPSSTTIGCGAVAKLVPCFGVQRGFSPRL
jgi:hypothetical protein